MRVTLERIRREGLDALKERLGKAGMIRFLQQFETGEGDYADERREWVDSTSLEDIKRHSAERLETRPKSATALPQDQRD